LGNHHKYITIPFIAALAVAVLLLLPPWSASPARAAGAADAQASELVRLINGERAYLGKPALRLDRFLASKARDGSIWCPNDASLVMAGRAKDIALFGPMVHSLRLCTKYSVVDAMKTWGYKGGRGEILAMNGGYGTDTITYTYGCSPSVTPCPGADTTTYSTTAHAMMGWMRSSGHYAVIVGSYDRVGCGGWVSSSGAFYYSCLFSMGGSPVATPKPTPKPTAKATPRPGSGGGGSSGGGAAATQKVLAASSSPTQAPPWPSPSGASAWIVGATESPIADTAGLTDGSAGNGLAPKPQGGVPTTELVLGAGGAAAAGFALPLLAFVRRRRSRGR
jgi:uncharacterized protein YkwD